VPDIPKASRRILDGLLLLDKPPGLSSNTALQRAKRLYNATKAGHTGTLDPLATGLLPVCFGEATKFSSDLLDAAKSYRATVALGVVTDTADAEGEVLERHAVDVQRADVEAVLEKFRGVIEQVPPMHSALKHEGRPLYKYAREGTTIERAPREVTIYRLQLLGYAESMIDLDVDCSKGTYIRTLAADIGAALGCGAHLASLRRTRVGALDLAHAVSLEALEVLDLESRDGLLLPPETLVGALPAVELDGATALRLTQGQSVSAPESGAVGPVRVYAACRFLGVATRTEEGSLIPKRLLTQAPAQKPE
jgi:tRNA pseudouridine55 synthase